MKKQVCLILLLMLAFCIVIIGCSKKKNKKTTEAGEKTAPTFTLENDGSFSVVYEEDFNEDYYDKEELSAMVDRELQEYNTTYGVTVTKDNLEVVDKKARLKLKFPDYTSYVNYSSEYVSSTRNARLFIGSYDEAVAEGYNFAVKFTESDKKTEFTTDSINAQEGIYVIFTNENLNISMQGEILAVSSNVDLKDNIIVTADKRENYIIFKKAN